MNATVRAQEKAASREVEASALASGEQQRAMDPMFFDPAERAREKASSRQEDARAIAAGEKTVEQVRRENAAFAFKSVRLRFPAPARER